MKKCILITTILLCPCLMGFAQHGGLSFDECVSMALRENVRVKSGLNDLSAARLQKKEAFTGYLPTLSLGANGIAANDYLIQSQVQLPPETQLPPQDIKLIKNGVTASAVAMLPIFAGGQIYNGNQLAKLGISIGELKLQQSENEVRKTVAQYYWQIVMLKDKIKTVRAVEEQLEVIYGDAQAAFKAGVSTHNDVLQVDLKKNEAESTSLELDNSVEELKMLLAQYIGMEGDSTFDIAPLDSGFTADPPESLLLSPENALPGTPEYQLLCKGVESAGIRKRITLGESLPKVSIGGGYFYNNLLDKSRNSWIGLVTVSVPINWKTGYSMRREKLAIQNATLELTDGSERLAIGMRKSYNDLTVAFKNIGIAKKSIEQAGENLRMHRDFYQAGTATMSELLDAQTLYRQSCDRYSEAIANYEIKKIEYMVMTGR